MWDRRGLRRRWSKWWSWYKSPLIKLSQSPGQGEARLTWCRHPSSDTPSWTRCLEDGPGRRRPGRWTGQPVSARGPGWRWTLRCKSVSSTSSQPSLLSLQRMVGEGEGGGGASYLWTWVRCSRRERWDRVGRRGRGRWSRKCRTCSSPGSRPS